MQAKVPSVKHLKMVNVCLLARHQICDKLEAQFFDELVANSFGRIACPGGYKLVRITGTVPLQTAYDVPTGEKEGNRKVKCKFEFIVSPGDRPVRLHLFSNSKATETEIAQYAEKHQVPSHQALELRS